METVEIKMGITHCNQCPFFKVVHDPDPTDSFNADDISTLCTKCPNDNEARYWFSNKLFEGKVIDVSIRPYQVIDTKIPSWCPFKNK